MRTAIPRASRSPMLRWPRSPSSVTRFTASGTTPSHPTSSQLEAVIPRHALSYNLVGLNVVDGSNSNVGEIKDLVMENGRLVDYVLSVGGFLGVGQRYVV